MPELPEVELLRLHIEDEFVGKGLMYSSLPDCPTGLCTGAVRKGKVLGIEINHAKLICFRFGLTGDLLKMPDNTALVPHERQWFRFDEGYKLSFTDIRGIGKVWVDTELPTMGQDVMSDDFDIHAAASAIRRTTRVIKDALMDQSVVAGIGNIYANEALFYSGIMPDICAANIPEPVVIALLNNVRYVMQKSLNEHMCSADVYATGGGMHHDGGYSVYGRVGEPCRVCGAEVKRIEVKGRGSFYCPHCQKG